MSEWNYGRWALNLRSMRADLLQVLLWSERSETATATSSNSWLNSWLLNRPSAMLSGHLPGQSATLPINVQAISEMLLKLCHHVCQLTMRTTINIMSACCLGEYIQTTFEIMIGDNMFRACIINEECWCWRDLIWPQNIVTHVGAYTMSITFQTSIRWRTLTSFGYYVICSNVCC